MSDSGIRLLSFSDPCLSASSVETLGSAMREQRDNLPLVIDCACLTEVTPAGLAALLELGRNATGLREVALTSLSRALTRAAIESGLSERFSIFATTEACTRIFSQLSREQKETAACEP